MGHEKKKKRYGIGLHIKSQCLPVIGEGGTTFLFVFLKNPSSGLLK